MELIPCNIWDWDWAICSDLASWMTFLLGVVLAAIFFGWQINNRRIRRNAAKESFVYSIEFISKNLEFYKQVIEDYHTKGEKEDDKKIVENEDVRMKKASAHMRFVLEASSDVQGKNFLRDVDFLIALLDENPISSDDHNDLTRVDRIKMLMEYLQKNELKEAKIIADADRLKRRMDEIEKILKEGKKSNWMSCLKKIRSKLS